MITQDPYHRQAIPILMVISGASGVGKDTIAKMVMDERPDKFRFVVTATTRKRRDEEINGIHYFFVSQEKFERMIEEDELVEYALVYNEYKGVPKQQIRDALASGCDVIMRVDVQGAATIRKLIPQAVFVFLTAESEEMLEHRLRKREADKGEGLNLRIATARQEMKRLAEFDYLVVNADGKPEEAVRQILCIIDAEHQRVDREPVVL